MKKIHIIFKTHLDIGFTDYAANVEKQYFEEFIPAVIRLANEVNTPEHTKFVWTTGSWLIYTYLKRADAVERKAMEEAIQKGYITWHAMPFTTHTELMNRRLIEYGLDYSKQLDEKFNKKTISAKMTDVPGHSISLVSYLAQAGVTYLHLGVNPASMPPDVPEIFRWRNGVDEVIVNYAFGAYGKEFTYPGIDEMLVFCHSNDNCNPPSAAEVEALVAKYESKYPDAEVIGSTLDAYAQVIEGARSSLPVYTQEFGDTWIHGVGTDPKKVQLYKHILSHIEKWIAEERIDTSSTYYRDFMDTLIMVPEHTWGMDLKLHFRDYMHYLPADFKRGLEGNIIDESSVPDEYSYISTFTADHVMQEARTYEKFAASWDEQRQYVSDAIAYLPETLQKEFYANIPQSIDIPQELSEQKEYLFADKKLRIGNDGTIESLIIQDMEQTGQGIGKVIYRQVGVEEYKQFFEEYIQNYDATYMWSVSDFSKPALDLVDPPIETAFVQTSFDGSNFSENDNYYILKILASCHQSNILLEVPDNILHTYQFSKHTNEIKYRIDIIGKKANRLPEEIWVQFDVLSLKNGIATKIDHKVNLHDIVKDGNENLHVIERLEGKSWMLEMLDAPLIGMHEPSVLHVHHFPKEDTMIYANIYNNIWGTNFPMWYGEDINASWKLTYTDDE